MRRAPRAAALEVHGGKPVLGDEGAEPGWPAAAAEELAGEGRLGGRRGWAPSGGGRTGEVRSIRRASSERRRCACPVGDAVCSSQGVGVVDVLMPRGPARGPGPGTRRVTTAKLPLGRFIIKASL